jgi:hypothetical protein
MNGKARLTDGRAIGLAEAGLNVRFAPKATDAMRAAK